MFLFNSERHGHNKIGNLFGLNFVLTERFHQFYGDWPYPA